MKKISSFKGYCSVPGSANTDTVRLYVKRVLDEAYYDFSDNTFKASGWTNKYATLVADSPEFHQKWKLAAVVDVSVWGDGYYLFSVEDVTLGLTFNDVYYFQDYDIDSLATEVASVYNKLFGPGNLEVTYTVTDSTTGLPLAGVEVWVTTDVEGLNVVVDAAVSNDAGKVAFWLDSGVTYYVWRKKSGYDFVNPQAITPS